MYLDAYLDLLRLVEKKKKRQPRNCFAVESNSVLDPVITSAAQQASGSLEITQDKVYQTKLK